MLSIYFNRRRVGGGRQGRWAEGKWSLSFSPRSRCSTSATSTLYNGRVKDAIVRPRLAKVFEDFFRPISEEVSMTSVLSLCYLKLNWCFAAMMTMIRRIFVNRAKARATMELIYKDVKMTSITLSITYKYKIIFWHEWSTR